MTDIFTNWTAATTAGWATKPVCLSHTLHTSPLFSDTALANLIDRYPRGQYGLIHTGGQTEKRRWQSGEIGKTPGKDVIDLIGQGDRNGQGRMWLNLRHVTDVDPAYAAVLDQMFSEIASHTGDLGTIKRSMGILISSPGARVYYHADMPGQALGQIRGRKRVYVYPAKAPFLTPEGLENIAIGGLELDLNYEPAFDQHATVFDLEPGQMLHWPLNCPHRVDNYDVLNVSFTVEYLTPAIRRHQIVTAANAVLRRHLGMQPKTATLDGPAYWAKAALNAGVRRSGLLAKASSRKPASFVLDSSAASGIRPLDAGSQS